MTRRPPRAPRPDPLCPYTTLCRSLGANGRQVDAGHSTAAVAVGQRRVAVMQLRYLRNETQAQATTAAPAVGPRQRVEAFENATDGVVRYARAAIGHVDEIGRAHV